MSDSAKVLLITPPFTQLNTPYPATAYLKGYMNTIGVESAQCDLGIEVILQLFSKDGISRLFETIELRKYKLDSNCLRMFRLKDAYINAIDPVIHFLQNNNSTLAYSIAERDYLPEASRFAQLDDLEWAFGSLGIQDKARHLSTLFLEDISDLIQTTVDPFFGFSRYAERISLSAASFDPLYTALNKPATFIDDLLIHLLEQRIASTQPQMVCLSVPFPGNLYSALRCGQYIKTNYPQIKVAMGGGYPNTELRTVSDKRLFEFVDFITLDDGEKPVEILLQSLTDPQIKLKRALHLVNEKVVYSNESKERDVPFSQTGTPDYLGLPIKKYLSVIELTNPMHRLWSDGRWNKLTMAHGCYWKQCTFCDVSLDYIKNYEPISANIICDRMEALIAQTGETGFHFVDEAAPPALMREVALEILKRKLVVSWWTNIRFEKRFTPDLCRLLKASGCIAVSGGLEVASDRLLELIKKGVTVAQVAQVTDNFTSSGIMVHAYLMYGFPTQTAQETVDSLEMVRQMFEQGVIQSGFWHQFALTAHSPIGLSPAAFDVQSVQSTDRSFAHNDLQFEDPTGTNHEWFSEGLRKSLFNYMHGICFEMPLQDWFDFEIPVTTIPDFQIEMALQANPGTLITPNSKLIWLHSQPEIVPLQKKKKDISVEKTKLVFHSKASTFEISLPIPQADWLLSAFNHLTTGTNQRWTIEQMGENYSIAGLGKFEKFTKSQAWMDLRKKGLLVV